MAAKLTTNVKLDKKAMMRIAIAKDVLKSLKALHVAIGNYVSDRYDSNFTKAFTEAKPYNQLRPHLATIRKNCDVCALGACLLSHVKLNDKFTVGQIGLVQGRSIDLDRSVTVGPLRQWFDDGQLALIETAFELSVITGSFCERYFAAKAFCHGIADPKERLKLIMRNIIKNKGTFIP